MISIDLQHGLIILESAASDASEGPGVYQMIASDNSIMYIGKAKNIKKRILQYRRLEKMPNRLRLMISKLQEVRTLITENESDALILEANLIKTVQPKFNIALKDGKSFPYIAIESHDDFPRITKHRGIKDLNSHYYGPFSNVDNLEIAIKELQKTFMIRSCSNNYFQSRKRIGRPCLLYQIKRCSGPCVAKISKLEYAKAVKQSMQFLSGESKLVQVELIDAMNVASANLEFERAAIIRDRIKLLTKMQEKNLMLDYNRDIEIHIFARHTEGAFACLQIFFMRDGRNYKNQQYFLKDIDSDDYENAINIFIIQLYETIPLPDEIWVNTEMDGVKILQDAITKKYIANTKVLAPNHPSLESNIMEFAIKNAKNALGEYQKEYLKQLDIFARIQEILSLPNIPERIEVYDNSHISGQHAFGCMIVAGINGFIKSEYRKFRIKNAAVVIGVEGKTTADDYAMLSEVLNRRLKNLVDDKFPSIMLIDGGGGHLSVAYDILKNHNLQDKIALLCIAKGEKRNAGEEWFYMPGRKKFQLNKHDDVLFYLQNLRDEVHRFAITTHRKARTKETLKSSVSKIPGIGHKKTQLLLSIFGSYERIKSATFEELASIKAIGKKSAEKINTFFRNL